METATELRARANAHDLAAEESFQRCDTDGFLTQWAHGINGQLDRAKANIAEAGGVWQFERTVLVTLDGEATDAREVKTKFGYRWRLDSVDKWLPVRPAREATLAKHGYREITETAVAPANAILDAPAGARGMSGACNVFVRVYRTDAERRDGWYPVGAPE